MTAAPGATATPRRSPAGRARDAWRTKVEAVRLLAGATRLTGSAAPRSAALLLVLSAGMALLPVAQVWLAREVINALLAAGQAGSGFGGRLAVVTALAAAATALPVVLGPLRETLTTAIEDRAVPVVDREIMAGMARLPDLTRIERPSFHDEVRLLRQVTQVIPLMLATLQGILGSLLAFAGIALLLADLHPLIPVAVLLAIVPQFVAQNRQIDLLFRTVEWHARPGREMTDAVRILTTRDAAREVRVLGLGDFFLGRFEDRWRQAARDLRPVRLRGLRSALAWTLPLALALGGSLWYVADRAADGRMTPGDIALFLTGVLNLGLAAPQLSGLGHWLSWCLPPLRQLDRFRRDARPGIALPAPGAGLRTPARLRDGIALHGVSFTYPGGEEAVLREIVAALPAGKVTALVGANGAGKSTIVKLLTRMYDPDAGTIDVDGQSLAAYDLAELRQRMSTTAQGFGRFALTLRQNVALGGTEGEAPDADVRRAAGWSGADEVAAGLPDGYDTLLGPEFLGGTDLSGGQWQRVALARSVVRDAAILILDEPNAALDAEAEARQIDRLHEVAAGRTVLLISHRLSTVRRADHILVLDGGRITERGRHDELLARGGTYAGLFALQADRFR